MAQRLFIFDTTLRDGEQSPGVFISPEEKIHIARQIERLGVDVIEAGFPAASPGDFAAVSAVAQALESSIVCALARTTEEDIRKAAEALEKAKQKRIHTFIATSLVHRKMKLRLSEEEVLDRTRKAVALARRFSDDVEFSAEDAGRTEPDFLCRVVEAAISAGASTINLPDTVGYNLPEEYAALIRQVMERVPNASKAVFSTHCHNDLGLAVANSLAGVMAGARQVEGTINGVGERAGNAALEEVIMAVRTRQDVFSCDTRVDTTQLLPTSRLVSTITGFPVQPNKAVVGANAFAHESGIHQDGVLKHRETYEIMRPEDIGWGGTRFVLGKLSGRAALRKRLQDLGIMPASEEEFAELFSRFKALADKKREVFDEDLYALVAEEAQEKREEKFRFLSLGVATRTGEAPKATVCLEAGGEKTETSAEGSGPVDATFRAIESIAQSGATLLLFSVNAITGGADAQGEVTVRLQKEGRIANGQGADTDILVAAAKAYVHALNRIEGYELREHPQV